MPVATAAGWTVTRGGAGSAAPQRGGQVRGGGAVIKLEFFQVPALRKLAQEEMMQNRIVEHHHSGPGIRLVQSGELTYIQPDKTTVYKAGDYIYESGDVTHTAYNRTNAPVKIINFELLPVDWEGPSPIPVPR